MIVRDMRNGDWFWIHKKTIDILSKNIGAKGIAVYNCLCYFANSKKQQAHPSIATISHLCQFSRRTTMRILKEIQLLGLISIEKEQGKYNIYTLLKDADFVTSDTRDTTTSDTRDTTTSDTRDTGVVTPEIHEQEYKNKKIINKNNNVTTHFFLEESHEIVLSKLLFSLIKGNDFAFKEPNYQKWAKELELLHRIDNRSWEEIESVIRWAQSDGFEKANILSPAKLRKRYTNLLLKMKETDGITTRQKFYNRPEGGRPAPTGRPAILDEEPVDLPPEEIEKMKERFEELKKKIGEF